MTTYKYSAEFQFEKRSNEPQYGKYHEVDVLDFCCEKRYAYDWIDFNSDFHWENEEFEKLPDGSYWCYVSGEMEFESDVDWDSGVEEGHWLLSSDNMRVESSDIAPF